ncbi:Uncharacterised protein [Mycobacteroides abscessus subsp. abscessus]|nr:Uncharacterised protein [Mycobacteroides abscessus subsp. abscessus]
MLRARQWGGQSNSSCHSPSACRVTRRDSHCLADARLPAGIVKAM